MNTRLVIIDKPIDWHRSAEGNAEQAVRGERRNFGWDAYELQKHYALQELLAWQKELQDDPAHHNPEHTAGRSIFMYGNGPQSKKMFRGLSDAIGVKGQHAAGVGQRMREAEMAKALDHDVDFDGAAHRATEEKGDAFTAAEAAKHWPGRTEDDALDVLRACPDDFAVMPSGEHWMRMEDYLRDAPLVETISQSREALTRDDLPPFVRDLLQRQATKLAQSGLAAAA